MYFISLWDRAGGSQESFDDGDKKFSFHPGKRLTDSFHACERVAPGVYRELGLARMSSRLRERRCPDCAQDDRDRCTDCVQILFYLHGFNAEPEGDAGIFTRVDRMQRMFEKFSHGQKGLKGKILVIPIIWPSGRELPLKERAHFRRMFGRKIGLSQRYHKDRWTCLEAARPAARIFEAFEDWQKEGLAEGRGCSKRISVLCHSMGNRLFREAMEWYGKRNIKKEGRIFTNVFMVAPEINDRALEHSHSGGIIPRFARNVIVYHAYDDKAIAGGNLESTLAGESARRLGEHGPRTMKEEKLAPNVYAVDCNEVNQFYDTKFGHSYFLDNLNTVALDPGKVFDNIARTMVTRRFDPDPSRRRMIISA